MLDCIDWLGITGWIEFWIWGQVNTCDEHMFNPGLPKETRQ